MALSLATSIDGRIVAAEGPASRLGSKADLARLYRLRAWADALVVAAGTVRQIDPPMGGPGCRARVVVLSRQGQLPASLRAFRSQPDQPPAVLATGLPVEAEHPFAAQAAMADVLHWPLPSSDGGVDICQLLKRLTAFGHRRIVVEGGGQVAAAFLRADALDELVVTTAPMVLGGERNDAFSHFSASAAAAPRFVLHRAEPRGQEVLTRWRRLRPPGPTSEITSRQGE